MITSKAAGLQYFIPNYRIDLRFDGNDETLFKPYTDVLVSDRVKHTEERIQDVIVKPFYREGQVSAILWYAQTNFNGTVLDNLTKGIRIRKGNILVGDCFTMSRFFKEDRFNGWLVGELFVLDVDVIPNSRRDDFEQNEAYDILIQQIKEWATQISKDIRKASYQRSLSEASRKVVETEDVNSLMVEDTDFCGDEFSLISSEESFEVAQVDLFDKLAVLLGTKDKQTKYAALNINSKLTSEQRKTLERVFDIVREIYPEDVTKELIDAIASKF
jgi:molecular chaperone HtpG